MTALCKHLATTGVIAICLIGSLILAFSYSEDVEGVTNLGTLEKNYGSIGSDEIDISAGSSESVYSGVDITMFSLVQGAKITGTIYVLVGSHISIDLPTLIGSFRITGGDGIYGESGRIFGTPSTEGTIHIENRDTEDGIVDITLVCVEIPHTVTFSSNGSTYRQYEVYDGDTVSRPSNPSRTGYTFGGWYTDSDCRYSFNFNTPITSDITLYAKWTIKTYTVTFKSEGSVYRTSTVNYNSTVSEPSDPVREGYEFGGWYTNSSCTSPFSFSTRIASNTTLYAKWTESSFTVSFDSNEGSSVPNQIVQAGSTAIPPSNPTLDGYVFDCWCSDPQLENPFSFSTEITSDITLYARWIETLVFTTTPISEGHVSAVPQMAGTILCEAIGSECYASLLWDLGDGVVSTDNYVTHYYASPGTYTVTLTVYNEHGSDTTEFTVNVPEDSVGGGQ